MKNSSKVVLVSGATSGIGASTASFMAANGLRIVAAARRTHRLAELAREAREGRIECVCADATEPGYVGKLFERSREAFRCEPSVFVLAAGMGLPGTVLGSDPQRWQQLLEVNYLAVLHQLRDCARLWLEKPSTDGVRDIVVIGSTVGRHVSQMNPVYGSTKFAVHSLVEALRQEVCGAGIRVTLVEPGFVKSEFQETAGYDMNWFNAVESDIGPLLLPDDVARVIDFIVRQPDHVHIDDVRIRPTRQKA